METAKAYLEKTFQESLSIKKAFLSKNADQLIEGARRLAQCINSGGKILIFGNGGSAADAQHMAAEMVGRMLIERRPLPAIALTTDSSNLTALSNDFSFDEVFSRQVMALAQPQDGIVAISTSGKSPNVLKAIEAAKAIGCFTLGLTGGAGGKLASMVDLCLIAHEGKNSSRIQESHLFAIHSVVDIMDRYFLNSKG